MSLRLIFGVATVLSVFSAFQAYNYATLFTDRKPWFPHVFALNLTYWYAWAILVPPILWIARRYPFERQTWRRTAGIHAISVVVFTFVHAVLTVSGRVPFTMVMDVAPSSWGVEFQHLFFLNFDWEMMTYWTIVGLSHAMEFHRESQERALTAAQLQTRLAEAQLQALQSQLHPHFLFNTLHTISALMHRDTEAADAMLARLSDLLRLTLERLGLQEVPLKEELEFLDKYLEIERTRFGERLTVQMDIEPETLDAQVPNLLLQPLVENAIRHGLAPKLGGGRLEIVSRRKAGRLWLVVRDNGSGLSEAKLTAFNAKGVGLTNTRSRLKHLYGDKHHFEFHEPPGGGLAVTIAIPFVSETEPSHDNSLESAPGPNMKESVA